MTTAAQAKKKTLTELLHDLPQELFDEIEDLTCTFDARPGNTVAVGKDYKPPVELQLNRCLRKKNSPVYYLNTTFVIQAPLEIQEFEFYLFAKMSMINWKAAKWFKSLPVEHLFHIRILQANTFYGPLQPESIHTGWAQSHNMINRINTEFYAQLFFKTPGYNELQRASERFRAHGGRWLEIYKRIEFRIETFASQEDMDAHYS